MEDLFYKYGVDMYFSGHVHSYERNYPVYQGNVDPNKYNNPKATTHLLIGGAGNDEMHGIQSSLDKTLDTAISIAQQAFGRWSRVTGRQPNNLGTDPAPKDDPTKYRSSSGGWSVITDQDEHVGIGKVHIVDDNTLTFEYVRTTTGEVFDSVKLVRDHSQYMPKSVL